MKNFKLLPRPGGCDDHLFNRRILAYYGLIFTVYWNHLVLGAYIWLALAGVGSDAALIALLGVPGTIAGLGFWKYLKAAEKEDEGKTTDRINTGDSANGSVVDNRQPVDKGSD